MAEMSTIAELGVVVSARNEAQAELEKVKNQFKQLDAETKKVSRSMGTNLQGAVNRTRASVTGLATRLAGLAAAYVTVNSAISLVQRGLRNLSVLDQVNQQTGISVDRLSELKFAAESLGVEFGVVTQAASQFGTRMTEAIVNPSSQAGQAIRALGLQVTDAMGNIRSLADLLPDIADRFASWEDGANKAAIASALFGEGVGSHLLPLLNRGSTEIEGLVQRARALGVTITPEAVARYRESQRTAAELNATFDALATTITVELGPALQDAAQFISGIIRLMGRLYRDASDLNRNIRLDQLKQEWEDALVRVRETRFELNRFRDAMAVATKEFGEQSPEVAHLKEEYDAWNAALERAIENQQRLALELAIAEGMVPKQRPEQSTGKTQPPPLLTGGAGPNLAIQKAADEAQLLMDRLLGQRLMFDELNFSVSSYAEGVQRAMELIRFSTESNFEAERQIHQLKLQMMQQQEQAAWDLAKSASSALASLFPKNKAFAIANAIINTAEGVTKALSSYPPPFNFGMAAAVAAAGVAQINAIRSANPGGGSVRGVSGGRSGGNVSQGQPAAPTKALTIVMPKGDIWSTERVAELIDRINNEVSNGKTLISTRTKPM